MDWSPSPYLAGGRPVRLHAAVGPERQMLDDEPAGGQRLADLVARAAAGHGQTAHAVARGIARGSGRKGRVAGCAR
eukprot:6133132-Prymnesium_polylepis.1